eukprot:10618360-Lingulodinium_polyedra.AAC.1
MGAVCRVARTLHRGRHPASGSEAGNLRRRPDPHCGRLAGVPNPGTGLGPLVGFGRGLPLCLAQIGRGGVR